MKPIKFKRGDTFLLTCQYLENGSPAPLPTGIRAQVRGASDTFIAELTVERLDESAGSFSASADTQEWKLGAVNIDVLYTYPSGLKSRTPTVVIDLVESVTHD